MGEDVTSLLNDATMISKKEGEYIKEALANQPEYGRLLELGTGYGNSAVFFNKCKPKWTIYTIDGYGLYGSILNIFNQEGVHQLNCQGLNETMAYLNKNGSNIVTIIGNTLTVPWELPVNLLFIDSDHSYQAVKADTERYLPFVVRGGIIIYHDCNGNWGVEDYFKEKIETNPLLKTWREDSLGFAERIA